MNHHRVLLPWKYLVLLPAIAVLIATQLSGCGGIPLPPFAITIDLAGGTITPTEVGVSGEVTVPIGAFCDLLDADSLDATIRQAAGDLVADLVTITAVELQSVQVSASAGNFSTFTAVSLTLDGTPPLPLGAAADTNGLGTSFTLEQETPVDLIGDLDGQCGVANALLVGSTPAEDITYTTTATVLVHVQLNP